MRNISLPRVDVGLSFSKAAPQCAPEGLIAGHVLRQMARQDRDDRSLHDRFHTHAFAVSGMQDTTQEREINKMLAVPPPPEFMRTRKIELANDRAGQNGARAPQPRNRTMALRMGGM